MSAAAIGIICKAPQPGRSKTRLASAIGAVAASELSACFLRDVATSIEAVPQALGRRGYGVYAPAGAEHIMRQLLPAGFGLLLQAGDDLGHVLLGATRALLDAGHDCVLLVNGDSPTLPARLLVKAIEALRAPGDRTRSRSVCLGIPMQVVAIDGYLARCTAKGVERDVSLFLLQDELAGHSTRFRDGGFAAASRAFLEAAPQIAP